ncbi:AAA family ATPase [Solibacillus sp. R5-41]|uniref:VWA domain-containing protein n=1 Tax=Solibacillus sp. R5-41 TaxID=2048654 RepID=UPI000C127051|nr:VWA domain-containing protein [Solibacillus sp. R5-41]ATP40450.1 AAA family ATPase [Solibacillus sp. R5-41]
MLYHHSIFDQSNDLQLRFNELLKMATTLKQCCMEGEQMLPGFTNLVGDCWTAFISLQPQLNDATEKNDAFQYPFIVSLLKNEEYKRWHCLTKGDELLSVLTAIGVAEQMKASFHITQAVQQLKAAEQIKEMTQNQLHQLRKRRFDTTLSDQMKQQQQLLRKRIDEATKTIEQAHHQLQQQIRKLDDVSISSLITSNKRKICRTKNAIIAVGTMGGKKIERLPLSDQFELVEQIREQKSLLLIAEMVGRFKKIIQKKQKIKEKQTMARQYISTGQEISRLLPSELSSFVLPPSKLDFLRRYGEQQTFIFDTKGKDRKGRGPIIICMDESSSMTSLKEQSKAFCIALLMIARQQKRDFAIIPFASAVGEVQRFKKGHATSKQLVDFSTRFLGGGTNFESPLRESLNILLTSGFNKADILFVTDGSSFLPTSFIDEFNEIKRKKQFECTAVVLTNLFNAVDLTLVGRFSDRILEVNELFEAENAFVL